MYIAKSSPQSWPGRNVQKCTTPIASSSATTTIRRSLPGIRVSSWDRPVNNVAVPEGGSLTGAGAAADGREAGVSTGRYSSRPDLGPIGDGTTALRGRRRRSVVARCTCPLLLGLPFGSGSGEEGVSPSYGASAHLASS